MSEPRFVPTQIEVVGGRLCLDFVNTRSNYVNDTAREYLSGYADFVRWASECVQAIDPRSAKRLLAQAKDDASGAARQFRRALEVRAMLHRLFDAVAAGNRPDSSSLSALNAALADISAHRHLARDGDGIAWAWDEAPNLARPLWPILQSAAEVLTVDDAARLKRCPLQEGCGWLYYDDSKNASRRWCSMRTCGNAAKVRAHYRRQRGEE